ncbi:unnamed protein product [Kuraishia capsulata CBS 1993]|uniref:Uncharacterized protein n=1 Tax=Kuraishia capsulata CBS 1993 TaxID=1382522 RepID=W6MIQ6_9ASCO|nr:uncharacterized protein KUCA_T00002346001 [Kuraishia capsulata CBS 1993]CDK26374.1 unnamed protein product [Kuraishia capsulata CBS 1993]
MTTTVNIQECLKYPIEVSISKAIEQLVLLSQSDKELKDSNDSKGPKASDDDSAKQTITDIPARTVVLDLETVMGIVQILRNGLNHIQRLTISKELSRLNEGVNRDRDSLERQMMFQELEMMKESSQTWSDFEAFRLKRREGLNNLDRRGHIESQMTTPPHPASRKDFVPYTPVSPRRRKRVYSQNEEDREPMVLQTQDPKLHTFHHYYNTSPIYNSELGKVTSSSDNRKRRRVSNEK